jgi:hypothetical protein
MGWQCLSACLLPLLEPTAVQQWIPRVAIFMQKCDLGAKRLSHSSKTLLPSNGLGSHECKYGVRPDNYNISARMTQDATMKPDNISATTYVVWREERF